MDLRTFPPKLSSARTYADPGIGSLLAVAVAWDDLAAGFRGVRLWIGGRDPDLHTVPRSGSGLALRGLDERDGLASRADTAAGAAYEPAEQRLSAGRSA